MVILNEYLLNIFNIKFQIYLEIYFLLSLNYSNKKIQIWSMFKFTRDTLESIANCIQFSHK